MSYSIDKLIKLREKTGLGVMDCKSALIKAKGCNNKAIEILRKKGLKFIKNPKLNEGVLVSKINYNSTKGVIIGINCETDFVAKNAVLLNFSSKIVNQAIDSNSIEELLNKNYLTNSSITIQEKLLELMAVLGENLILNRFEKIESKFVFAYVHNGNKMASLVGLSLATYGVDELAKNLAMQIVAMNPLAINSNEIPCEIINKEKEILKEQISKLSKPKNIRDNIIKGKLEKFVAEKTLSLQPFIKNPQYYVGEYIKKFDRNIFITSFKRVYI